ncbi:uncharacterized protein LOC119834903 [Zerene cesonia]|uniref:uncharacterized protein LOC119834903 n=1 Tax=Zerene cesonia TaxID=33412 RepID=UPI0018E4EFD3|nr:uncharacterized protein LOC119834903 [Zerene cesonia]
MAFSPRKTISNFTNTTANRGTEAKEIEIANTRLDVEPSRCRAAGDATSSPPATDSSASYVQVVVQKQKHGSRRLPLASSPTPPELNLPVQRTKNNFWRRMSNIASGREEYWSEEGPDRLEVYPFERGCEVLWSRSAARVTHVERLGRALSGPAGRSFGMRYRKLSGRKTSKNTTAVRCALSAARAAVCGAVQALADEALKPALALGYNALARPPLVLAAQLAAAARDALRPLWLALADAAEPLARLLANLRLVHVETRCACPHNV